MSSKGEARQRRHKRIRTRVKGTASCPRLCVFRSSKHIYGQIIDDEKNMVLVSASDLELKGKKITAAAKKAKKGKSSKAYLVGQLIAKKAVGKKIDKVVFDRGGYKFHGRVKTLAQAAREGGLKF